MTIFSELTLAIENDIRLSEEEKTEWKKRASEMDEVLQDVLLQALRADNEKELEVQKERIIEHKKGLYQKIREAGIKCLNDIKKDLREHYFPLWWPLFFEKGKKWRRTRR